MKCKFQIPFLYTMIRLVWCCFFCIFWLKMTIFFSLCVCTFILDFSSFYHSHSLTTTLLLLLAFSLRFIKLYFMLEWFVFSSNKEKSNERMHIYQRDLESPAFVAVIAHILYSLFSEANKNKIKIKIINCMMIWA